VTQQEKYADKIALLLRKAESTTPQEAELLISKAQELMTKYAIEEAMIDAARGVERDEITEEEFIYVGIFRKALGALGYYIMQANGCRGVYAEWPSFTDADGKTWKEVYRLNAIGFKSDIERIRALDASLQLQATTAMTRWWKEEDRSWYSRADAYKARREFLFAFASGVNNRLHIAKRAGEKAAAKDVVSQTSQTAEEATASVALVLRSRKDRVDDWIDEKYGKLRSSSSRSYASGGAGARTAGFSAGSRADIGQPGMGSRKAIGK
jgi:hypothetical protein